MRILLRVRLPTENLLLHNPCASSRSFSLRTRVSTRSSRTGRLLLARMGWACVMEERGVVNRYAPDGEVQGCNVRLQRWRQLHDYTCTQYAPLRTHSRGVHGAVASVCVKHTNVNADHKSVRSFTSSVCVL